ncbi:MAG: hypothetical protein LBF17_02145 [Mediterranea sp.]|jgi:hypothetical protein|nr:hypothetical protein [Mediterranea sp.]
MKKVVLIMACALAFLCSHGQEKPRWLDSSLRNQHYPEQFYFTGFAYSEVTQGSSVNDVTARAKNDAQADLSKKIRVKISSATQSGMSAQTVNGRYDERESFSNVASTTSDTEVAGLKIESYYDANAKLAYAFAYVNKQELTGYYKANIGMLLQQAEGSLNTAIRLEQNNEKAKARAECERARPLFPGVRYAQDLLIAVDADDHESLQLNKSVNLYNEMIQMLARLAQGVYVYIESSEDFFGKPEHLLANKLKAQLAANGCSFVEDAVQADFKLRLNTTMRTSETSGNMVFCYADVEIELYDTHKQKVVYNDEVSQKGGSVSQEKAGRKALEDAVKKIITNLIPWIK